MGIRSTSRQRRAVVAPAWPTSSRSPAPSRRSRWCARCPARRPQQRGKITTRHQGGGHKRQFRVIDFRRSDKDGVPAKVAHIEYDPNRTARIALLHYVDGEEAVHPGADPVDAGGLVEAGPRADIKPGNNLPLRTSRSGPSCTPSSCGPAAPRSLARPVPECNSSRRRAPGHSCGCPLVRSATSTFAAALIGEVGNAEQSNINWGKAGRMRWKGKRPAVRGVAMNPVDHPHGGGEGKTRVGATR